MSTGYYRDYERVPCRFTRVITSSRFLEILENPRWDHQLGKLASADSERQRSLRVAFTWFTRQNFYSAGCSTTVEGSPKPSDENGYLSRNILTTVRLLVLDDDVATPVIYFQHSRKHSRVSGAHYYHTGPPCSGVLANRTKWMSSRFPSFSPSPLPSPFFPSLSLYKRRRISGPFNPGFLTAEDPGGTEGQRVTDTALRRQHSRIMQFSDVLIWQRSCKRLRTHTRLRLPSTRRSCRTTDAPRFLPGLTRNSAVRSSLPSRMEGHSAAGM